MAYPGLDAFLAYVFEVEAFDRAKHEAALAEHRARLGLPDLDDD